jgi:hypothetical protein
MSTTIIETLMELKEKFPINNIYNRKRYSVEEINNIIDAKIKEVLNKVEKC